VSHAFRAAVLLFALSFFTAVESYAQAKRLVVIKVDGLPEDLLERHLDQLPAIRHIFTEQGAWLRSFYVRGISLSAPSWAMLDTGQPMVIRGNAEFDRFTLRVYDYLNFVPFYVGYARSRRADMPGVDVLDEAGIPLLIDSFPKNERYQSMQLYQRGVRWQTLGQSLRGKVARPVKDLIDEWQTGLDLGGGIELQEERELIAALDDPQIVYLDYYTGDVDHTLHLTNDPAIQLKVLKRLDATVGRIRSAIDASPQASGTVLAMVSDHGMNSVAGTYSQGYSLVSFFNSAAGGGHHVISIRHPLSEYTLRSLDPFVSEVLTPSEESLYLRGEKDWPTARLDLDGNERASVQLRNSDLNEIQILLQQLKQPRNRNSAAVRSAVLEIIDRNRAQWSATIAELSEELAALNRAIARQKARAASTDAAKDDAVKDDVRRETVTIQDWEQDERGYPDYIRAMQRLLDLKASDLEKAQPALPKGVFGENNSLAQIENYTVGPSADGLATTADGSLDLNRSFAHVNYFEALSNARVRNVVQADLGDRPIDFIAMNTSSGVYLYGDAHHGALVLSRLQGNELWLRYMPVSDSSFTPAEWDAGFPLHLFEDPDLQTPGDRKTWLSEWHSEREWFEAIHRTQYSNGLIGVQQYRIADARDWPLLRRFAARRRRLVAPDLLVVASNHWNFDVRGFNPGGNHGSFFRISTHSVLMLSGAGIPAGCAIDRPYDSLSFTPTLLALMGRLGQQSYPGPVIGELMPDKCRPQSLPGD
jgi:hypothetical protein